ncbi:hypothetical protein [Acinetobacter sp. WZC-1]|uniref:hypothetical protein n=1 Tax=Acinetobacter sp. WZC-1 TaxID=3459034 RepID=UPI00403DEA15
MVIFIYSASVNQPSKTDSFSTQQQTDTLQNMADHIPSEASTNPSDDSQEDDPNYTPINEKEFSGLFKHQKPAADVKPRPGTSPFDNAFGSEQKSRTAVRPAANQTRASAPITLQTTTVPSAIGQKPVSVVATDQNIKEDTKDQDVELPKGSVQISITQTPKED